VTLDELQAVTWPASVEKETGRPEERPRISWCSTNRLKKKMRLQTDRRGLALLLSNDFQWDHNSHKDDLSLQHPYNTYFIKGLPPGPIANPGLAALGGRAASGRLRRSLLRLGATTTRTYSVQI